MSSGFMSFKPSRNCPSTITRGDPVPSRLVPPRRTIVGAAPGLPDDWITFNPETAPESACAGLENKPTFNVSCLTFAMELVVLERS